METEPDLVPNSSEGAQAPAAAPHFDAALYRAAGSTPLVGALLLFAAIAGAGLVIGLVASLVAQLIYLVIIFPLIMGFLVGMVGVALVKYGKVRGRGALALASVLAAVITMLGMHVGIYVRVLREIDKKIPGIMASKVSDPMVFVSFIDGRAQEGVQIGHAGARGGNGLNLGYVGSYIYWLVEMGCVGFVAFGLMHAAARMPLCEMCQQWKKERTIGCLPDGSPEVVSGALLEGHLLTLLQHTDPSGPTGLILKAAACPECGPRSTVEVGLEQVTLNAKGQQQRKQIARVSYPGDVLAFLDAPRRPA